MRPPEEFTTGALISIDYVSPRSHRLQTVSGRITDIDPECITIRELWLGEQTHPHRLVQLDTVDRDLVSVTTNRTTLLGRAHRVALQALADQTDDEGLCQSVEAHFADEVHRYFGGFYESFAAPRHPTESIY
ncbi:MULTISPECIES: hypothetical protein [unclassified Haladaptatus]|uniref:hypothetical protein n=1 Tax=unclassified Haladaptatus TaxID=2622732 RepID=UPI0023E7C641|nr:MULTISPECIES: hypothetical protein [unclassified Haladaptatus]